MQIENIAHQLATNQQNVVLDKSWHAYTGIRENGRFVCLFFTPKSLVPVNSDGSYNADNCQQLT